MADMNEKEMAQMIATYATGRVNPKTHAAFVDAMRRMHNTEKQRVVALMCSLIKGFAEEQYVDGRNEASVNFCKKVVDQFGDEMYFPFV